MAKAKKRKTFKERIERRRKKAAERDDRWRTEETIDEVVAEVSRLREQREADARTIAALQQESARLKKFVGSVPVDSDGQPLITVRERLEQYEEQYKSLLDQSRDQMAKVIAADGMAGLFADLKQRVEKDRNDLRGGVETAQKAIDKALENIEALRKDLQSPPAVEPVSPGEMASLRERVRLLGHEVGEVLAEWRAISPGETLSDVGRMKAVLDGLVNDVGRLKDQHSPPDAEPVPSREVAGLRKGIQTLKERVKKYADKVGVLRDRMEVQAGRFRNLAERTAAISEVDELRRRVDVLEREAGRLRTDPAAAQAELDKIYAELTKKGAKTDGTT